MRSPRLMSEILKGNTFALNVESSLPQAVVFKTTSNSTLDNSVFIARSVAKDTTATMDTKFTWINIKGLSINVNFVQNHLRNSKAGTITHPFIRESIVSPVTSVVQPSTKNNSTTNTSPYTVREGW